MFDAQTRAAIEHVAGEEGIEPAALLAIAEVESAGRAYAVVGGEKRPLIRFEGHYFDRFVPASKRAAARAAGLASPKAGAVRNPAGQRERWQMLMRAMEIDREAAIMSVSWGIGQVMGSHWDALGYASPRALFKEASSGVAGQIRLMVRFLRENHLLDELRRHDWSAFARAYNGPAYRKNRYDTRMAEAYARYRDGGVDAPPPSAGMLRLGSNGKRVRELQVLLRRAGFPVAADGDFGPATKRAVMRFQDACGLDVDGVAGPRTMEELVKYRETADEEPGAVPVTRDPDVGKGIGVGGGGAVAVETAKRTIEDTLLTYGHSLPGWLVTGLTVVSVVLALGGVGFAVVKILEKRRTREGTA
jgi:hypothetical protein